MKRWHLFAIGLGVYLVAVFIYAPATLIDAGLQRASDGRLRVTQAQGSLWSGTGNIEFRDARGRTGLAKQLAWRIRPSALLRAGIAYEVEFEPGYRPFPVTLYWSRIELANADIHLPASALAYVAPKLTALGLAGDVDIQVARLSIGRDATLGSATAQWRNARSALSPVAPLGDYELRFDGDGATTSTRLRTLKGPLQLEGQGSSGNGGTPEFRATARMSPEFQRQLAPFLRLIAVERGDGSFEWQLD